MKDLKTYKLKLTALGPVHIGTGEVYEPTNFVIDDGWLYEFDEVLFYKSLSDVDKRALDNKISNWLQIIEFYKTKKEEARQISFFECSVSKEVEGKYSAKNPNQLQINKTFKNPNTHRAIIPGSSTKGMLDTVFGIYPPKSSNEERQKLIVSDALLLDGGVEIGYSNRKHRNKKEAGKGIPQMVEVIKPNSTFILTITTKFSFEQLQNFMKLYHNDRKNSLYEEDNKSFTARVGKYSGKEYMVDSNRNLKNSYGKPLATHSLYNSDTLKDKMFGWIKFELINDEIYQKSLDDIKLQEQSYYENRDRKQAKIVQKIEKAQEETKAKELQKQKEIEEKQRKAAELKAEKEAKLAAMSPFERKIDELVKKNQSNMSESVIVLQAVENGEIDEEFKCEALDFVKEKMIAEKSWKERSSKPNKDKAHKRTLKVIEMLKGC